MPVTPRVDFTTLVSMAVCPLASATNMRLMFSFRLNDVPFFCVLLAIVKLRFPQNAGILIKIIPIPISNTSKSICKKALELTVKLNHNSTAI